MAEYEHPSREGREASYYELALSNRQVFFAVVALLVGLAGAFLTGVWFARSSSPPPRAARAAPVEPAVKEAVGEYNFFSEKEKAAPPKAPRSAAQSAAPELAASPPVKPPQAAVALVAPAAAPSPPASAAKPSAGAGPDGAAGAEAAAAAASGAGDLFVQVFSSADIAQAKRVVGQLQRVGYKGFIAPLANVNGQTLHRVRVGPYRQREVAQKAADAIRQKLKFSTWITNTQ